MDSAVLKMRALVARVGAALAAFMLVFSLLMLTSPARADSKSWMEVRFKGDSIIFTNKVHFYNMPQDDYTKGSCDSSKEYVGQTRRGGTTTRVQLEQYKGVEVCVVEGVQPLETMITSPFPGYIFTVSRDGDNLKVQGSYIPDTVNQTFYSFTFDGGIVSASGGAVTGNTVTVTDTSFEIVGNPDPSVRTSSSPSASSGATSLGALLALVFLLRLALLALRLVTQLNRKRLLLMRLQLGLAQPVQLSLAALSALIAVTTPLFMGLLRR